LSDGGAIALQTPEHRKISDNSGYSTKLLREKLSLTREKECWFKLKGNAWEITMTDPITTLTASAKATHQESVTLAFQEFIKSGAGELAKKFTGDAIAKMKQLRELIWSRITGKHPVAEDALAKAKAVEQEGIEKVATLLGVELLDETISG
jgi:hypothetical protein